MVEMTSDLKYTIEEKIKAVNEKLGKANENTPAVSLSVGVAFSDRKILERVFLKKKVMLNSMVSISNVEKK